MSTRPAEWLRGGKRRGRKRQGGFAALVLAGLLLQACGLVHHDDPPRVVPVDVAAQLEQVLQARARTLKSGNEEAFLATVDPAEHGLVARERRWFDNLQALPVGSLGYVLDRSSLVVTPEGVSAVVRRRLQLTPYDAMAVVTPDHVMFTLRGGRYLLASDDDLAWQRENGISIPPWDTTRIEVRSVPGVLGIFDQRSVADADPVLGDVRKALDDVSALVPGDWSHEVVIYALSDLTAFRRIDDLPGGDPGRLDGVAFPVAASPWSGQVASTRFVLHPRMLDQPGIPRQRLIRHELTHVAVGIRDDHVPVWLSEGLAEWVSVQPILPGERAISEDAVAAARAGVASMPADATFNGQHSGANYGLAWWACEWIASTYGPSTPWQLLDAMAEGDGTTDAEQDAVLQRLLGINSRQLARHAARRILATFG
jgi:hypothetical protein